MSHSTCLRHMAADNASSTGAGDTFIAGILYCMLLHPDIDSQLMVRYATRLAGHKVAQEGFDGLGNLPFNDSER